MKKPEPITATYHERICMIDVLKLRNKAAMVFDPAPTPQQVEAIKDFLAGKVHLVKEKRTVNSRQALANFITIAGDALAVEEKDRSILCVYAALNKLEDYQSKEKLEQKKVSHEA